MNLLILIHRWALRFCWKPSEHHPTTPAPLGPLGFNFSQHGPPTRPSVERTADKASSLSDRVQLSCAEGRVEGIVGGSVGVF